MFSGRYGYFWIWCVDSCMDGWWLGRYGSRIKRVVSCRMVMEVKENWCCWVCCVGCRVVVVELGESRFSGGEKWNWSEWGENWVLGGWREEVWSV